MMDFGSLAGGVVGSIIDYVNAREQRNAERAQQHAKQNAIADAIGAANVDYNKMMQLLDEYDQGRTRIADDDMAQQYKALISNYEPQVYDFNKFNYNKTVEDFINPEAEKIAQLAGLETQAQAAGIGAAKGTGGAANIGYSRWKAAEQLYKDAQNQLNADRTQAYHEYGDYIDRMQNKLNIISQGQLQKAQLLGGAVSNEQQQQADYMADLLGIMSDKASTNVNATIGAF
mgnify:CR=1 FL=1